VETLLDLPELRITVDRARGLVRVDRSPLPFESTAAYDASVEHMTRALAPLDRKRYVVLIDIRQGPLRSGPEFEQSALRFRHASTHDFARAAVLVQTQIGKLQLARHAKEQAGGPVIFTDEAEALRYLGPA
jgi:hypothetical protein